MSTLRMAVALVFAGLYALLMWRVSQDQASAGALTAAAPVATLAITYVLGIEISKVFRRNGKNGNGNGKA